MGRKGEYRTLEMRVWQSQLNSLICKCIVEGFFLLAAPNCSLDPADSVHVNTILYFSFPYCFCNLFN